MKKKLKPLLPSLKERKRYLAFEIVSKDEIEDYSSISEEISAAMLDFMGELGAAEAGAWLIDDKWNKKLQRGLIRVNNKHVHKLKTALALIQKIKSKEVIVKTLGVSGIMDKAEKRYLAG